MAGHVSGGDDPHLGLVLGGQFRLDALVGTGSMARVYRARQLPVARDVAVKVLRRELLSDNEGVARFRREARIAACVAHPNVVVVHAVGELPGDAERSGAEPYTVLELLEGPSLAAALTASGGVFSLGRSLHVTLALCDALGEAHARGIVHRDIKPDNVMLVRRGEDDDFVKVLDFGLARVPEEQTDIRTRAGAILGTPRYVSPEGAQGLAISPAADCYSLCTVLYECLAGRTPFEAESALAILVQHATAIAPDLRELEHARSVPDPICDVIMANLAKEPERRAPHARALGHALVDAARRAGMSEVGLRSTLLGTLSNGSVPEPLATVGSAATVRARISSKAQAAGVSPARSADTQEHPASPRDVSFLPLEPVSPTGRAAARSAAPPGLLVTSRSESTTWLLARRLIIFVLCFLLGAAAALGIASGLGAFAHYRGQSSK